ncbi:MAG: prepilin-type N-terminal cleavage/methylation domain-containing protein [Candidatus Moraniibacteriota bacterium]|nr:MAG: prepilin-type N-terminal cleavage/methylation domain-containing protein [Candidatus Moranbacteria bacterium]
MSVTRYRGFTFIEMLLVLGISALMLGAIFSVVWNIFETSRLSERYQAAQLELVRVTQNINRLIRDADSLESISPTTLSLGRVGTSEVVTLTLRDGVILLEQAGTEATLTSGSISITGIDFREVSSPETQAHYIMYDLQGSTVETPKPTILSLPGGAETRSLMTPEP